MQVCLTADATTGWVVAVAPGIAAVGVLAQSAAICQRPGMLHAGCAPLHPTIQGKNLIRDDVALNWVAVLLVHPASGRQVMALGQRCLSPSAGVGHSRLRRSGAGEQAHGGARQGAGFKGSSAILAAAEARTAWQCMMAT